MSVDCLFAIPIRGPAAIGSDEVQTSAIVTAPIVRMYIVCVHIVY